ncbi:hypothetical protein DQ405_019180 [Pseudomonas sp. SST3]|uniref:hypothetical protein n=1 Tax=Pseudomonas sp. SST3 TaxID=2267882 RepID=UPI0014443B09|nr:hypothetical protein [Pseudomonas sp. SST3]NKQ12631.1 hypothetical protein [Pseudomonas sp. SST3]
MPSIIITLIVKAESGMATSIPLFVPGHPSELQPFSAPETGEPWPSGDEAIAQLIAVSMDAWGQTHMPVRLQSLGGWRDMVSR